MDVLTTSKWTADAPAFTEATLRTPRPEPEPGTGMPVHVISCPARSGSVETAPLVEPGTYWKPVGR